MKTSITLFAVTIFVIHCGAIHSIPVTGGATDVMRVSHVRSGFSSTITSVLLPGELSFPVIDQPLGQSGYVSSNPDALTNFQLANKYGVTGLLAHNYLAGKYFFNLEISDRLVIEYSDGAARYYKITAIKEYQALNPTSPYSDFIDLDTKQRLTATALFFETYGSEDKLILQTCIEKNSLLVWGRLFVVAEPIPNYFDAFKLPQGYEGKRIFATAH